MSGPVPLKLFNSLTRELEEFQPVHPGVPGEPDKPAEARVYSCGPTVYNYQHIGNMRAYVFADTLGRTLRFKGYDLKHIINITDVGHLTSDADAGDDKMEKAAALQGKTAWDIAAFYTGEFKRDLKWLNVTDPAKWTVATDYVPAMIDYAKSIADKHCYELDSGLYFDVSTVPEYGRLARAATDEGEGRIDEVSGKRHQADFAIWRKTPPGESRQMEWDSPWGRGAPGWHLECSVMSAAELGMPFDIHTGGIDHREIHHPNEIAQNQAHECSAHTGANIWMHNNFLIDRGGKMSKSAGEFLRLQLLADKGFHPLAYRLMCLQAHYRSELEFSWEGLQAALVRLRKMALAYDRLAKGGPQLSVAEIAAHPIMQRFDAAISDDLNTPRALVPFEEALAGPVPGAASLVAAMDAAFGLGLANLARSNLRLRPQGAKLAEADIERLIANRNTARKERDFATSDRLRDELAAQGVEVMDGDPLGWDWKLEA